MQTRKIKKIFPVVSTSEGAGVVLRRGFGFAQVPLFDPFLLLDDFGSDDPKDYLLGFPWHPHRGIETVTYILEGSVAHEDSIGNKGVIGNGDVQWMTAGSGIVHQEMPQQYDGTSKGFQLWVNLPKVSKMIAPYYQGVVSKDIPIISKDGVSVKVISGKYGGVVGPVQDIVVKCMYFDVSLEAGAEFSYNIPEHYTAFLYVFEGNVKIGEDAHIVEVGNIALTNEGERILVKAQDEGARFLCIAGEPINEPVAWHGPIVMNTQEELAQAFAQYRNDTFIKK